jgi:dTDP-D-glucose 4,6-dehydratase
MHVALANQFAEIIPKFSCLLERGKPVVLHGDGTPTRRYLYAGDAADAFDTILHKGTLGQIYNVGSYDEISNLTLCSKLLTYMDIPHKTQEQLHRWVKHTRDRPFNDHRYAVDGTKLRKLGWDQKTSFAKGLAITVDWYRKYGETWWGDITQVLTPFPTVAGTRVIANEEPLEEFAEDIVVSEDDNLLPAKKRRVNGDGSAVPC